MASAVEQAEQASFQCSLGALRSPQSNLEEENYLCGVCGTYPNWNLGTPAPEHPEPLGDAEGPIEDPEWEEIDGIPEDDQALYVCKPDSKIVSTDPIEPLSSVHSPSALAELPRMYQG